MAYEAGRDGFWLARWLRARGIECHVIHPTSVSVSREHRRAKSDRLDVGLLKRSFLGWLRGEKKHCSMVAVPTREEEDGKRPLRERERLVGDATRLVNRMKGLLALHGIAKFEVRSKTAPQRLRAVRSAEGELLPPDTLAELLRAHERLQQIQGQITAIETTQRQRLRDNPEAGLHPMILLLARVYAWAWAPPNCWCARPWHAICGIAGRWHDTPAPPARPTRAAASGARKGWPRPVMPACGGR